MRPKQPKNEEHNYWDHFCMDANEILRFYKNRTCDFCGQKYISSEEQILRNKIPSDHWNKFLGNKNGR